METSLFKQWIEKFFPGIVIKVVETINQKNEEQLTYRFKNMLRPEFSVTGKWNALSTLNTRVKADFVAMDSSLPLKRRDAIQTASGDIAKSGMELWLNEQQLTELDTLIAMGGTEAQITSKLFQDTPKVISGIYELMEDVFLQGLSSGVASINDNNAGTGAGVRLDYGYLDENKSGVIKVWSNASEAKPLTDIRNMIKKAKLDGNTITKIYMSDITFSQFVATAEVKQYFAWSLGFVGSNVPIPSLENVNKAFANDSNYKVEIEIVDRAIVSEKNGSRTTSTPWATGKVILTTSSEVGVLAYARLAEQNHPVNGVDYEVADDYILVSKYRKNSPLGEYTNSQARAVPVICNVEQIYQLDSLTAIA